MIVPVRLVIVRCGVAVYRVAAGPGIFDCIIVGRAANAEKYPAVIVPVNIAMPVCVLWITFRSSQNRIVRRGVHETFLVVFPRFYFHRFVVLDLAVSDGSWPRTRMVAVSESPCQIFQRVIRQQIPYAVHLNSSFDVYRFVVPCLAR